jgi:TRAP-type mannitol/chloroaromatic compound transport system permease small subunit
MPKSLRLLIRIIDAVNYRIGRITMYMIFAMMGVLLLSSFMKTFFLPPLWTLEVAQFLMVAYYMLGGPYSLQLGSNVRMDLLYGSWSDTRKAWFDAFTVFALIFYLGVMLYGAVGSSAYSLGYYGSNGFGFFWDIVTTFFTQGPSGVSELVGRLERSATAWRPYLAPIKIVMSIGIFMMLLQALSIFFKDVAKIRGEEL